jgi:ABC-type multidrug transport system fused ATPase/permease subunit
MTLLFEKSQLLSIGGEDATSNSNSDTSKKVAQGRDNKDASRTRRGLVGEATNIMSNDVEKVFEMILYVHYILIGPIFVLVVLYLMVAEIGWSALCGFGGLLLMLPMQATASQYAASHKKNSMQETDKRTSRVAEVIKGIHVVKLMSWEEWLLGDVLAIRRNELALLARSLHLKALIRVVNYVAPTMVALVTFAVCVALEGEAALTLERIYLTLGFLNVLRAPLLLMPKGEQELMLLFLFFIL